MRIVLRSTFLSVALLGSLLLVGAAQAAEAPKAPVVIKADGAKMAPVTFAHEKHGKVDCAKCHHVKDKPPEACKSCHDVKEAKNNAPKTQDAFHKLCLECHKAAGGNAPTKCNDCHKK